MILGGKIMNNAYQTYPALTQDQPEDKKQHILFIPEKKIRNEMPVKMPNIKTVKGTQSFDMIRASNKTIVICEELSCTCMVVLGKTKGRAISANTDMVSSLINFTKPSRIVPFINVAYI